MMQTIEAVYENGSFRPLETVELTEGQRVTLSVEPVAMSLSEAEAQLRQWRKVYEGLSERDIAEIEAIALDRSNFFRKRDEDEPES